MRLDRGDGMAVGANRSLPVALGDGLSVYALLEFLRDRVVALPAGGWHIELEDRALGVFRVENLVRAVAVGADRGFFRARGDGVSVDTHLIRSRHLRALTAILHYEFLAVAGAACRGNVGVVHARLGIARRQQFMRAAVAVNTAGRLAVAALHGFAMEAAIVGCLLVGVAAGASDPFRCRLVRRTGYISVA